MVSIHLVSPNDLMNLRKPPSSLNSLFVPNAKKHIKEAKMEIRRWKAADNFGRFMKPFDRKSKLFGLAGCFLSFNNVVSSALRYLTIVSCQGKV